MEMLLLKTLDQILILWLDFSVPIKGVIKEQLDILLQLLLKAVNQSEFPFNIEFDLEPIWKTMLLRSNNKT